VTAAIQSRLETLERVIESGLRTFVEVGEALMEIRDQRLYQDATFEDYCRERWGFSRIHAHRLMDAAEVVRVLPAGNTPANEAQARELAPLKDQPDALRDVWGSVIERAEQTDSPVTGPVIRAAVRDYMRGQAAGAAADLDAAVAGWTEERQQGFVPELVRQRGELARLVTDLAQLPPPHEFVAKHRGYLSAQTVAQAERAHAWTGLFLEEMRRGD
jgi:hypothetical protein